MNWHSVGPTQIGHEVKNYDFCKSCSSIEKDWIKDVFFYIIETILDVYRKLTLKTQNAAISLKAIHIRLAIKKGKKNSIFLGPNSAISAIVIFLEANENLLWICAHNTSACYI